MNTPIVQFLKDYECRKTARFHMPGHKGRGCDLSFEYDITEIDGADVLYGANGIIHESECNASMLYGSAHSFYSVEGSSLCIRAMITLCVMYASSVGRSKKIFAGRNAHASFLSACALSGVEIQWLYNESQSLLHCTLSEAALRRTFEESRDDPPVAVYLTSPDYLGNIQDITTIADLCHRYGALLLVDNAHGAYLNFLPENHHPLALGADLVCDSAHKTLPALTGCSYLHVNRMAPPTLIPWVRHALRLFASTSPSYLMLASLDELNVNLDDRYRSKLAMLCERCFLMKKRLREKGYLVRGDEPIKLTLLPKQLGYTGIQIKEIMSRQGIECEYADPDHIVFMLSTNNSEDEIEKLEEALLKIPLLDPITSFPPLIDKISPALSPRDALFSPCREIPIEMAEGRILAQPSVSCPPAVPIGICGEIISKHMIEAFSYYGIKTVSVIEG